MKANKSLSNIWRSITVTLLISLFTTLSFGQNLVIQSGGTFIGDGTINVKGNITNNLIATPKSISGIVVLNGAGAQTIGGTSAINFETLNLEPTAIATTTLNVASSVSTAVNIGTVGFATTLDIGTNTLSIGGTSTLVGSGALSTSAGSTVAYTSGTAGQVVLGGFTYNGNVTLTGNTKTLSAAGPTTVAQAFDATGAGLLTVSGGDFTLTSTGAFASLSNSAIIKNGTGLTSFAGAVTNTGTINGSNGAGAVTFSSSVDNNGGIITGGASNATTFNGLLTQASTGILTSGAGGITLTAGLTNTSGNITVGASQSMSIAGAVSYTAGTLNFDPASSVTYGALATTILDASYGNLTLNNDAKSWALTAGRTINGNLTLGSSAATTVSGNFALTVLGSSVSLAADLTKSANAVVFTNAGTSVSGANEIVGAVNRNHTFAVSPATYTFNRAEVALGVTTSAAFNVTLTNNSSTSPSAGTGLGSKYVNRQYKISGADFTTNNATLKLYYTDANKTGSPSETRLVFKKYATGTWSTIAAGLYTRNVASDPNDITLSSIASNFTGETELGVILSGYSTIANGNWNSAGTWDGGDIPASIDDATISALHTITVPTASTIANLTIASTGGLSVDGANFTATSINNSGALSVSGTRTLLINGGDLTNNGAVTNAGTITIQ
jgi:hypothetical protein